MIALVLYPYVYLSARTMFQFQSAEFAEAAKTLGAGRWTTFWRISLPMARPALAVGLALVSLETLNDIGASEYLGVRTLTVSVFTTWLNRGSLAGAAQISCLMLAIVAGLIALERYGRRNVTAEFSAESPRLAHADRDCTASRAAGASPPACCRCCSDFSCRCSFSRTRVSGAGCLRISTRRCGATPSIRWRSRALPRSTALLLGFATILAWRWRPNALRFVAMTSRRLGYALPGLVLALGLLAPVLAIDDGTQHARRMARRSPPGLIMVGSGAAVVIAYVIRFLAVPAGFIEAGFERIPRDYDDSARAVGAGQPRRCG